MVRERHGETQKNRPAPFLLIPQTSQFIHKIRAHEERHVEQLTTGVPGIPVNKLWNAKELYDNVLVDMTSSVSEADLLERIRQGILDKNEADLLEKIMWNEAMEADAYRISNKVSPFYLQPKY